jgi:predicted hotdog family 3-hydroxylacyl-ACP dehydratase
MRLLSRVIEGDEEGLAAEVTVQKTDLFYRDAGVGAWVGIEYMAQAIAAWAGWRAKLRDEEPKVGFLLGSRKYVCARPFFLDADVLRVDVQREIQAESGLGRFDCSIHIGEERVAHGHLAVFEPADAKVFLAEFRHER